MADADFGKMQKGSPPPKKQLITRELGSEAVDSSAGERPKG